MNPEFDTCGCDADGLCAKHEAQLERIEANTCGLCCWPLSSCQCGNLPVDLVGVL